MSVAGGFVPPAHAARSNDPLVRQFVQHVAPRIFANRKRLASDITRDGGTVVLRGFPELLVRPPKRGADESAENYERRRADGMQSTLSVLCTLVACCDWGDHSVRDPHGGYLSVARLAELADLPTVDGEPTDRTERALAVIRCAKILSFTKQHREQKPDGKFRSTGPALRRMARQFFRTLGAATTEIHERRCRKAAARREAEERERGTTDLRVRAEVRGIFDQQKGRPTLAPPAASTASGRTPPELIDAVQAEHPDWPFSAVLVEAQRRHRDSS